MLDDIDYSDLNPAPKAEPKKKSNIAERSVVKPSEKPTRKPVNVEAISKKAGEMQTDVGAPEIPDPLAQYGLPALGALGALGTAYGVYKSLQNKNPPPPPPPPPPSGPDYNAYNSPAYLRNAPVPPDAPVVSTPTAAPVAPSLPQQTNLSPADLEARAAQTRAAIAPVAPEVPVSTPITVAPVDAPAPTPSAAPNSPVTSIVTDTVKEMIQETPVQPEAGKPAAATPQTAVKPAYPKAGKEFKTEADIPPGFVARYDVGNLDRSMGNILGLEHRAHARDLFNQGKPFGQSANLNKDVSDLTKRYFQQIQSEIPETILGREARQAQKIPSEFGVFAKTTPFGTGVKIGGRAATLFALSDIANAQTPGQRGMAGANLLEAVLPPGFTMSGAGEGSSTVPSADQAMLLGSPYAQSPLAVKQRQALEYERKVGAGRGIAPPSAYLR